MNTLAVTRTPVARKRPRLLRHTLRHILRGLWLNLCRQAERSRRHVPYY